MDKYNPEDNPLGHLIFDAPEYIIGLIMGSYLGKRYGNLIYKKLKKDKNPYAIGCGIISGSIIGVSSFLLLSHTISTMKQKIK